MWYKERGRYVTVGGGLRGEEGQFYLSDGVAVADRPYIPQPGDLIYIEWYKYNRLDHVGIVEFVTQDGDGTYWVHTIEGNNHILGPTPSVVQRYTYRLDDDSIRGYGVLTEGLVGWELGMGASGSQVIALQKNLKELGYYSGAADGIYGNATKAAVKAFQKNCGITADGVAGPKTLLYLGLGGSSSGNSTGYSDADVELLAKVISAEARGESYEGQVAVGAVILNRVAHPSFPNSISGVVYQNGAFSCVNDSNWYAPVADSAKRAATDALNGWDPSGGAVYYFNAAKTSDKFMHSRPVIKVIGNHKFCS